MPKRKMYQWDTKIDAKCLKRGFKIYRYKDIKKS